MTTLQRVNLGEQRPAAYKALIALSSEVEEAAAAAGLNPLLVEPLRIRTSQINGCAFCLRLHTRDALKKGETPDRIAVLPAWAETDYFLRDRPRRPPPDPGEGPPAPLRRVTVTSSGAEPSFDCVPGCSMWRKRGAHLGQPIPRPGEHEHG
jgi:AhpD family alkylhydroperoxidase